MFAAGAPPQNWPLSLIDSDTRFAGLMEAAPDAIVLVDEAGRMVATNARTEIIFGYARAEMIGQPVEMLMPECFRSLHHGYVAAYVSAPRVRPMGTGLDVQGRRKDGTVFPAEISLSPLPSPEGLLVISIIRDVTERRRHEQQMGLQRQQLAEANQHLQELATRDGLTGLKNHRALTDRLQEEWRRALRYQTPLSLLMLDLDHFKRYNDDFGHLAGDEVLQAVARLLEQTARDTDFVARFGGEEFVVLLPFTDYCGAGILAERFRAAIADGPWTKREVTASVGAATFLPGHAMLPNAITDATSLLAAADGALYQSKNKGRNRVTQAPESA